MFKLKIILLFLCIGALSFAGFHYLPKIYSFLPAATYDNSSDNDTLKDKEKKEKKIKKLQKKI